MSRRKKIGPHTKSPRPLLAEIRRAVADYMHSEGCSCCRDYEGHKTHEATLARLLRVPKFSDSSGYNFSKFRRSEARPPQ